jgi:hypothetical protein
VNVQQDDILRLAVGQNVNNAAGEVSRLCQQRLPAKRSVLQGQYSTLVGVGTWVR